MLRLWICCHHTVRFGLSYFLDAGLVCYSEALFICCGRLAQLVERLVYTENVGGSSPSPPIP